MSQVSLRTLRSRDPYGEGPSHEEVVNDKNFFNIYKPKTTVVLSGDFQVSRAGWVGGVSIGFVVYLVIFGDVKLFLLISSRGFK